MKMIPVNITEPLMTFNVFCIVGEDVAAGIVLVMSIGSLETYISQSVAFGAKSILLFLNYAANQILTPSTDGWLSGERECRLMIDDILFGLLPATFCQKWRMSI